MSACRPVLASLLLLAACRHPERSLPPVTEATEHGAHADADPTVLVVVHSWSGRTERIGRELAGMLGAKVYAFHDPPMEDAPAAPPSLDQILQQVSLRGVRTLLLGFPVWGETSSPPVRRFVSSVRLDGVRVVPFYSFIHRLDPTNLALLRSAIEARGGEVLPELPFLIPLAVTDQDLDARAERALLQRRDVWGAGPEEAPAPACGVRNDKDGAELCHVTAGLAWLGDGGPDAPRGASPPRRVRVGAFDFGRTEVTVGRYARCVAAGGCEEIDFSQSFCKELLAERPDQGALPLPCATYTAGEAYCRWAGMRLPSEAEWTRAARGDTTRAFPWGDAFATDGGPLMGNFGEKKSSGFESYSTVPEDRPWARDGFRGLAPPCSFPGGNSMFGICDLSGNVAEWVRPASPPGDIVKGGSWLDGEPGALRVGTSAELPSVFSRKIGIYVTGIRCARDAP